MVYVLRKLVSYGFGRMSVLKDLLQQTDNKMHPQEIVVKLPTVPLFRGMLNQSWYQLHDTNFKRYTVFVHLRKFSGYG